MLNADIAPITADSFTRHRGPVTSVAAIPGRRCQGCIGRYVDHTLIPDDVRRDDGAPVATVLAD